MVVHHVAHSLEEREGKGKRESEGRGTGEGGKKGGITLGHRYTSGLYVESAGAWLKPVNTFVRDGGGEGFVRFGAPVFVG